MRVMTIPEVYLVKTYLGYLPMAKEWKFQEVSLSYMKILYKYGILNFTRSTTVMELKEQHSKQGRKT